MEAGQMVGCCYKKPEWELAGRVHDWRNYVEPELQEIWHTFTDDQKRIIAENFDAIASTEEWD
jgi:hypothetical protein